MEVNNMIISMIIRHQKHFWHDLKNMSVPWTLLSALAVFTLSCSTN